MWWYARANVLLWLAWTFIDRLDLIKDCLFLIVSFLERACKVWRGGLINTRQILTSCIMSHRMLVIRFLHKDGTRQSWSLECIGIAVLGAPCYRVYNQGLLFEDVFVRCKLVRVLTSLLSFVLDLLSLRHHTSFAKRLIRSSKSKRCHQLLFPVTCLSHRLAQDPLISATERKRRHEVIWDIVRVGHRLDDQVRLFLFSLIHLTATTASINIQRRSSLLKTFLQSRHMPKSRLMAELREARLLIFHRLYICRLAVHNFGLEMGWLAKSFACWRRYRRNLFRISLISWRKWITILDPLERRKACLVISNYWLASVTICIVSRSYFKLWSRKVSLSIKCRGPAIWWLISPSWR